MPHHDSIEIGREPPPSLVGRVASLHLHPEQPGAPLQQVNDVLAVAGKGITGNPRHFGRVNSKGTPSRRQVSLIAREQIAQHAAALGLASIEPGAVRANIETEGVELVALVGWEVLVGEALLFFFEARTPCHKMDAVAPGLQRLMANGRQGVLAEIVRSGPIAAGDLLKALARRHQSL